MSYSVNSPLIVRIVHVIFVLLISEYMWVHRIVVLKMEMTCKLQWFLIFIGSYTFPHL